MNTTRILRTRHANGIGSLLLAAGAGALTMYLLDPQQGRRRLALLRDQVMHGARCASEMLDVGWRDLGNRSAGMMASMRSALRRQSPDDAVLAERVRARLGRLTSHPHNIEVSAEHGCVTLAGKALAAERQPMLLGVQAVPGVQRVQEHIDWFDSAGREPSLQGGTVRTGPRTEYLQQHWAPGPRLLALAVGSVLAAGGLGRRGAAGWALGLAGAALAGRVLMQGNHHAPTMNLPRLGHRRAPAHADDGGQGSETGRGDGDRAPGRPLH